MSGTNTNPMIPQGTLNRVRCHIVVPSYPSLSVTSSNMGTSFATISFTGDFVDQIPTATGIVNSPAPYVMASIAVSVLRTQSLANLWLAQMQSNSVLGNIDIHSDTAAFPKITIYNASAISHAPGAYDGKTPLNALQFTGVYYINNSLWSGL